jgi:hypothetical protein
MRLQLGSQNLPGGTEENTEEMLVAVFFLKEQILNNNGKCELLCCTRVVSSFPVVTDKGA